MELPKPYFLTNPNWYYYDENDGCYKLTDSAPDQAKESYEQYYNELDAGELD